MRFDQNFILVCLDSSYVPDASMPWRWSVLASEPQHASNSLDNIYEW